MRPHCFSWERVDDFLTVYLSLETGQLVGCQVKGLPNALKLLGDFGLVVEDDSVRLGMIFVACMAASPGSEAKQRYREVGQFVRSASIPVKDLKSALKC